MWYHVPFSANATASNCNEAVCETPKEEPAFDDVRLSLPLSISQALPVVTTILLYFLCPLLQLYQYFQYYSSLPGGLVGYPRAY